MKFFYFLIFLLLCRTSNAQNLTGVWTGVLKEHKVDGKIISNSLEVQILQTEISTKALVAYTLFATGCDYGADLTKTTIATSECYSGYDSNKYVFNSELKQFQLIPILPDRDIRLGDCKLISCAILGREKNCLLANYRLIYSEHYGEETLSGIMYKGKMDNFDTTNNGCNDGYDDVLFVSLKRKTESLTSDQAFFINKNSLASIPITTVPFLLDFEKAGITSIKPILKDDEKLPAVLENRENEQVKTIKVNSKEIEISIYDYGEIDHDIISVYVDKKPVLIKKELTKKPLIVNLEMDKHTDSHEVILVAENLGDIPPNTALMKIKAGSKKYEIKITSTEQKNAVINFKYKE